MLIDLLQRLLEDDPPTAEELDQFLRTRPREDLRLDFKHGKELDKPKRERARDLRAWVAGFANAEGGVLVIGVAGPEDAGAYGITGLPDVGSGAAEWATRSLSPLAPYLVPSPRIYLMDHPKGQVLLIATDRAPNLVPCIEDGKPVHYLRIGDETPQVDPYLYADLVLGRRQRPQLSLTGSASINVDGPDVVVDWRVELANEGLVWAEEPQFGVLGYWSQSETANRKPVPRAPAHLLKQVHAPRLAQLNEGAVKPVLRTFPADGSPASLAAMNIATGRCRFILPHMIDEVVWTGAVYVVCRNSLPLWAQGHVCLQRTTGGRFGGVFDEDVKQLAPGKRPLVWWGSVDSFTEKRDSGTFDV